MILCPLKHIPIILELEYTALCDGEQCSWWDSKANYNPKTKQFEGQCCILTLSRLKISGGINIHAY